MEIDSLAKRYPTIPFILWFIGIPSKEITWKHKITGKEVKFQKAYDGQATFDEIRTYLEDCAQIEKGISRSMIHFLLKKLIDEWGLVQTVGSVEKGKSAVYSLTELGRETQHLLALYYDLRIKIGQTSGVLGHDKDLEGQLYFVPMIQIKKREDVELILKAMSYVSEKRQADKFLNDIIELQKIAILMYCANLLNSQVSIAFKELLGEDGLKKAPGVLSDFFRPFM
jgi:DNA-binding HxlR family transcriptional regulator